MRDKKKKFDIKQKKDNTIKSLKEVEAFLRNLRKIKKGTDIYKILKNRWKGKSPMHLFS